MDHNLQDESNAGRCDRLSGAADGNISKGARWTASQAETVSASGRRKEEVENVRREGIRNAAGQDAGMDRETEEEAWLMVLK